MRKLLLLLIALLATVAAWADDMASTPLTLEAVEDGTFTIDNPLGLTIEYSTDGTAWTSTAANPVTVAVSAGDKVSLRGDNAAYSTTDNTSNTSQYTHIRSTMPFYGYGNMMSLVDAQGFATATTLTGNYTFACLFYLAKLRNHPGKELLLPATTLTTGCYARMFYACSQLKRAPSLPATSLAGSCYAYMFWNCSSLKYAKCLATVPSNATTYGWLTGTAANGTLEIAPGTSGVWTQGRDWTYPNNWTAVVSGSELPYDAEYTPLTVEAVTDGTVTVYNPGGAVLEYSRDSEQWTTATGNAVTLDVTAGDRVSLRGDNATLFDLDTWSGVHIEATADVTAYGNVMSLLDSEMFPDMTSVDSEYCFFGLFNTDSWEPNTTIKSHPDKELLLPATSVAPYAYAFMFNGCEGLTRAPALPATSLGEYCYDDMFAGCRGLSTAPALPATDLSGATGCYTFMFRDCVSLTTAPALPATTLGEQCYDGLFMGCTSLVNAPALPATTLASGCYSEMFMDCTALTTAPRLAAPVLADHCYLMMFNGCESLNEVTCLAGDIAAEGALTAWLDGVAATGTFVQKAGVEWPVDSPDGIPAGWTIDERAETPYAIWVQGNRTFYLLCSYDNLTAGGTFTPAGGDSPLTITALWSGDQVVDYTDMPAWTGTIYRYRYNRNNYFLDCASIIVEPSFASARPRNLNYFFGNNGSYTNLSSITGLEYLNTSEATSMYYMFAGSKNVYRLDCSRFDTGKVTDMSYLFYNCNRLTTAGDLSGWDLGRVTHTTNMFYNCSALTAVDVSTWDMSHVVGMSTMFMYCSSLTALDVSRWNTSNVTDMTGIFCGCSSLTAIDVSGWDTGKTTYMYGAFRDCSRLAAVDVSGWNTAGVTGLQLMFYNCSALTAVDVSGWNTDKVTALQYMFAGCGNLESVDVSRFNTSRVTDMSYLFDGCRRLSSLDLSGWDTRSVRTMEGMLRNCSGLTALDCNGFYTSNVTNMGLMFQGCSSLESVTVSNLWTTANVIGSGNMFTGCTAIVGEDGTTFDSASVDGARAHYGEGGYLRHGTDIELGLQPYAAYDNSTGALYLFKRDATLMAGDTFIPDGGDSPATIKGIWYGDAIIDHPWTYYSSSLTTVNIGESFADVRPTSTASWFDYCHSLAGINGLEYLNTVDVTDMSEMFFFCESLKRLDVSHFNTASVTEMGNMFYGCNALEQLEGIGNWNTGKVKNMYGLFTGCMALTHLDLSRWDVSRVESMTSMFRNCPALTHIDLGTWDTSKCTSFVSMFGDDNSLVELDLRGWDTSHAESMDHLFTGCSALQAVYIGEGWNTSAVTDNAPYMFYECYSIVGQDGTRFDDTTIGLDKAHAGAGGYLRTGEPEGIVTLAEMLDHGVDAAAYHLGGTLLPVAMTDDRSHAFVTDGEGNWVRLDLDAAADLSAGTPLTGVSGVLAGIDRAPALSGATALPTAANVVDVEPYITQVDLSTHFDMPQPNSLVRVTGYYFDGELRGWHSNTGQSLTLATDYAGAVEMVNGEQYELLVAIELKEAWSGAPRRARSSYDYDFQNLVGQVVSASSVTPTAIEAVTHDRRGNGLIFDLQGRLVPRVTTPGIYIIDGKKVYRRP